MRITQIKGKTALITGASSGIGKACAVQLASIGVNVIVAARRIERLDALCENLQREYGVNALPIKLDVRDHQQVDDAVSKLSHDGFNVDILVNNAGLALSGDKIQGGDIANWNTMIDTNLKGLLFLTRAILPSMMSRNDGHIINIGSVAGHDCYVGGNIYCATKFAVRAISKSLRLDLLGTAIRISEVDPGAVETEFSEVRWQDKEKAKSIYQGYTPLVAEDIADMVVFCATRPPHVNVSEVIVYPQAQASVSHTFKK